MIKMHQVQKDVESICSSCFVFDKFDPHQAEKKIEKYLEGIKNDFHHIEYSVNDAEVKLMMYTSIDDGFDLSFKMKIQKI